MNSDERSRVMRVLRRITIVSLAILLSFSMVLVFAQWNGQVSGATKHFWWNWWSLDDTMTCNEDSPLDNYFPEGEPVTMPSKTTFMNFASEHIDVNKYEFQGLGICGKKFSTGVIYYRTTSGTMRTKEEIVSSGLSYAKFTPGQKVVFDSSFLVEDGLSIKAFGIWKLNTYNVTYNANGGSGAPSAQTKVYGEPLTLSSTKPTRSGYTFKGWATSSGATTAQYQPGGSYTGNSAITLYAVWKNAYTVSYNANGGSGAPSSQIKTYGETLTLSSTKPTRSGYTFKGWATSSSATTAEYQSGGSYTKNEAATLYAVWDRNTYSVTYNANGGNGAPSAQTKTYGQTLTLSSVEPTRTGYTFKGWSTNSSAATAEYQSGGSYTKNETVTLYAVWERITYTIFYNANGGSGAPSSQTKNYGEALALSSVEPTRTGYTFKGWSTSSTATEAQYQAGSSYTSNEAVTLYAVWERAVYTISYNANGGSGAPSAQTKTYGQTLILSSVTPTRTGYTFKGWSTSNTATTAQYHPGSSYTNNEAVALYAVWERMAYAVRYNANGGSGAPSAQTKTYGQTLILSSVMPSRTGYTFKGWSTSSTVTTAQYQPGGSYTQNGAVTLYAVWEKIIHDITAVSLKTQYTYTGRLIKPSPVVMADDMELSEGIDYYVTYNNNKAVGTARVTVSGMGNYSGTITKTFKIVPSKLKIRRAKSSKLGGGKTQLIILLKSKPKCKVSYYLIQIAKNKKFTKGLKVIKPKVKGKKLGTFGRLKKGKTYYTRVRAVTVIRGVEYFGPWSNVKKFKGR